MGLSEIKGRSLQYASRYAERLRILNRSPLITEHKLLKKLKSERPISQKDLFLHFRNRDKSAFLPAFDDREKTLHLLRQFQGAEESIINSADRICEGVFRLLGSGELSFGGRVPDWHFEPLSGKRSPLVHWSRIAELSPEKSGDKKVIWELNRHQYFSTLGQAYWITGEEKYATTFVEHLDSWMDKNPPKKGVNWLSSLELAFRSISWIWAIQFFKDSPKFTPELLIRSLGYLYLHGRHIETYLSTYYSPNTHLTGEALGLYYLGTFLPETEETSRWKALGHQILLDALDFQVRTDGTYCEQSSHYLRYTIDFYCSLLILLRAEQAEIDPKLITKLNQLFDFLLHISQPNGETPNFGDDDGGRLYQLDDQTRITDLRATFALGAVLLGRGDLKFAAGEAGPEILWLLGEDGINRFSDLDVAEPKNLTAAFRDGGFYTVRSDWTRHADFILIKCGPFGFLNGGHAHAHTLGFLLTIGGEPIFVDSGTFNYTSEPRERDYFRSSAAHNCLTVSGESSSIPAGPFSWKSTAPGHLLEWLETAEGVNFRGSHNGFERSSVSYEREIVFGTNGSCEVAEHLDSRRQNRFQLHFVLSPHISAEIVDTESKVTVKDRQGIPILEITTAFLGETSGPLAWSIEDCFISPIYGSQLKSKKLTYTFTGTGRLQIRNRITKLKK